MSMSGLQARANDVRVEAVIDVDGLAPALARAVAAGTIEVVYQPIVATSTGTIVAVEALARWRDRRFGAVPPSQFIPIAERSELIHQLGRHVLERACRQVHEWTTDHPDRPPLQLSVNLSAAQFGRRDLASQIVATLDATGLAPEQLCLEITETAAMNDVEGSIAILETLRSIGCRVAIDDFGTGFSSLNHLRRLPIDAVKIDRSFVLGLDSQPVDAAIVGAVIALAWVMGIGAVAEGVERPEELSLLARLGCPFVQGFAIARPLPAPQLEASWTSCVSPDEENRSLEA